MLPGGMDATERLGSRPAPKNRFLRRFYNAVSDGLSILLEPSLSRIFFLSSVTP